MKYLCTIYDDETQWSDATPEQMSAVMDAYNAFGDEARAAGVMAGGEGLEPTSSATTVRVRDGERVLSDGPFAETKEQLGGFYLIDVADLDQAIEWAKKVPMRPGSKIEVRAIMDLSPYGYESVTLANA